MKSKTSCLVIFVANLFLYHSNMQPRIKILHITQSVGGVETYLKQIISTIDHSRFELKIIGTVSDNLEPYCVKYGVAFTPHKNGARAKPVC